MEIKEIILEITRTEDGVFISAKWRKWFRYSLALTYIILSLSIYFAFIKTNLSIHNIGDTLPKSKYFILLLVFLMCMYITIKGSFDTYTNIFTIVTITILGIAGSIGSIFITQSVNASNAINMRKLLVLLSIPASLSLISKFSNLIFEYKSSNEVAKNLLLSFFRKLTWWLMFLIIILAVENIVIKSNWGFNSVPIRWLFVALVTLFNLYIILFILSIKLLGFKEALGIMQVRIAVFAMNIVVIVPTAIWHIASIKKFSFMGEYLYLGLFLILSIILVSITIFEKTAMKSPVVYMAFSTLFLVIIWVTRILVEYQWHFVDENLITGFALLYTSLFVMMLYLKVEIGFWRTVEISSISLIASIGTIAMWAITSIVASKSGKIPELYGLSVADMIYFFILISSALLFLQSMFQWMLLQRRSRKIQKNELKKLKEAINA